MLLPPSYKLYMVPSPLSLVPPIGRTELEFGECSFQAPGTCKTYKGGNEAEGQQAEDKPATAATANSHQK